jgi:hypothetical protein
LELLPWNPVGLVDLPKQNPVLSKHVAGVISKRRRLADSHIAETAAGRPSNYPMENRDASLGRVDLGEGKRTVNSDPFPRPWLDASIMPPCNATKRREIASAVQDLASQCIVARMGASSVATASVFHRLLERLRSSI